MTQLGTIDDIPREYLDDLAAHNLLPLWPSLRNLLPFERPTRKALPAIWHYDDVRPLVIRAGEITPIEKAERRVLILANPGYGSDQPMATPTIYLGLQLIMPGETAPCHKHIWT